MVSNFDVRLSDTTYVSLVYRSLYVVPLGPQWADFPRLWSCRVNSHNMAVRYLRLIARESPSSFHFFRY